VRLYGTTRRVGRAYLLRPRLRAVVPRIANKMWREQLAGPGPFGSGYKISKCSISSGTWYNVLDCAKRVPKTRSGSRF